MCRSRIVRSTSENGSGDCAWQQNLTKVRRNEPRTGLGDLGWSAEGAAIDTNQRKYLDATKRGSRDTENDFAVMGDCPFSRKFQSAHHGRITCQMSSKRTKHEHSIRSNHRDHSISGKLAHERRLL